MPAGATLVFKKIEYGEIFTQEFRKLNHDNEIDFSKKQIAVIYGPNGTGKTSLIRVLGDEKNTNVNYLYMGAEHTKGSDVFYIIHDQNSRNIIAGETRDFFLGDNIRHEFELQDQIAEERSKVISAINLLLKNTFSISAANSPLIDILSNRTLAEFIKDCANVKSKGDKYPNEKLVSLLSSLQGRPIQGYAEDKLAFIKNDLSSKESIIKRIESLNSGKITPNAHVYEIEETAEAIDILTRFHKDKCIVCDNVIDREQLLARKIAHHEETFEAMDDNVRKAVETIIHQIPSSDPFKIKEYLFDAIASGRMDYISELLHQIDDYKVIFGNLIENEIIKIMNGSELRAHWFEYQQIISEKLDITEEDYLYIREIINGSMSKPLTVERDANKRLHIFLSNQEFLGKERSNLPLSSGEQNFLSLAFEFLKAKNSEAPVIVIDDPISSFDSIYKNKVVYAIVKMLQCKERIVLTHNTDLIRLLDGQFKNCFKLYILNNTEGEANGFIPVNNKERGMLISIEKLLNAFREDISVKVLEPELFLISLIPFMRGYANIINDRKLYEELSKVMHGYKHESVDIANAYSTLFAEHKNLPSSYMVSVEDILSKSVEGIHIIDNEMFPLLDKTLRNSFEYLFLRLLVEKKLVERYNINTDKNKQLGQIISAAFPDENDPDQIYKRIRLTSKKTLINEFNHFEGNLSIFQPAIDISDSVLAKEKDDITLFMNSL